MIGKKIKVNDYKFTYGQDTVFINAYGAFKNNKNGNKYIIYSYNDDNKLHYGNLHIRDNEAVIMSSKEKNEDMIKEFLSSILEKKKSDNLEIVSLDNVQTVQIIDEYIYASPVDINLLDSLTIPKPVVEVTEEPKEKKRISLAVLFFSIFVVVVIAFFIANPEVIVGKDKKYLCTRSYSHNELPASVNEKVILVFNGPGKIKSHDITYDYVFTDTDYYDEFKNQSYFYKYFEDGDTYKFDDSTYTYRLFTKLNPEEDYFLPKKEEDLLKYYRDKNYTCKVDEADD